jgi:hypothetical protein
MKNDGQDWMDWLHEYRAAQQKKRRELGVDEVEWMKRSPGCRSASSRPSSATNRSRTSEMPRALQIGNRQSAVGNVMAVGGTPR